MNFQLIAIIVGLTVGFWRRGTLWNLSKMTIRFVWLLPIGYVLQTYSITHLEGVQYQIVLVLSYMTILVFCISNLRQVGIPWTTIGTAANFLCMLCNGLRMPAYIPVIRSIAPNIVPLLKAGKIGKSIAMSSSTKLNFLGDIFTLRIHPVILISIGDILFAVGIAVFIQHAMLQKEEQAAYGESAKAS